MSGWRRIPRQSASFELRAALHHAVRQRELPDVVQQPGGVRQLLLATRPCCASAAMSRAKRATAAQWRAARWSRSSSVRTRLESTPQERFAYSRACAREWVTSRDM